MSGVVFAVHGAGYHGREADFRSLTADVAEDAGVEIVPVYWGDLAADEAATGSVTARPGELASNRDTDVPAPSSRGGADVDRMIGAVEAAVKTRLSEVDEVRLVPTMLSTIDMWWPKSRYLRHIDDVAVLTEFGEAIVDLTVDSAHGGSVSELDFDTVLDRIHRLDRLVGVTQAASLGRVTAGFRALALPGVARFLADLAVYWRRQKEIQRRIRQVIAVVDPALGQPECPVDVVAHSLGGAIALDAVVAEQPLWIGSLVTLGVQWPLFHQLDHGAESMSLPESLGTWTNVWEPFDPLAFVAGRRYRLTDGRRPRDVLLAHRAGWGLWTHSVYWRSSLLARLLNTEFTGKEG